jgi:hypothetical protein
MSSQQEDRLEEYLNNLEVIVGVNYNNTNKSEQDKILNKNKKENLIFLLGQKIL